MHGEPCMTQDNMMSFRSSGVNLSWHILRRTTQKQAYDKCLSCSFELSSREYLCDIYIGYWFNFKELSNSFNQSFFFTEFGMVEVMTNVGQLFGHRDKKVFSNIQREDSFIRNSTQLLWPLSWSQWCVVYIDISSMHTPLSLGSSAFLLSC